MLWAWLFRANGRPLPGSVHVGSQSPLYINIRLVDRTQLDLIHCEGWSGRGYLEYKMCWE